MQKICDKLGKPQTEKESSQHTITPHKAYPKKTSHHNNIFMKDIFYDAQTRTRTNRQSS